MCVCVWLLRHVQLFATPWDCSPPGFSVHGIFQARVLEWFAMPSSRGSSWPRKWTHVSCISGIGRQILNCWATWETTEIYLLTVVEAGKSKIKMLADSLSGEAPFLVHIWLAVNTWWAVSSKMKGVRKLSGLGVFNINPPWFVILEESPLKSTNVRPNIGTQDSEAFFFFSRSYFECFHWPQMGQYKKH